MRDDLNQAGRQKAIRAILAGLLTLGTGSLGYAQNTQKLTLPEGLSQSAINQITALEAEKASRTPAQLKMDSQLIYASMQAAGAETSAVAALQVNVGQDAGGNVLVDIDGVVSPSVLKQITKLGGAVVSSFPQYGTVRARMPLEQVESLADNADVRFIKPAVQAELEGTPRAPRAHRSPGPLVPRARRERDARLRATLPGLIKQAQARRQSLTAGSVLDRFTGLQVFSSLGSLVQTNNDLLLRGFSLNSYGAGTNTGSVTSEGDATHRADLARATFGATGAAIRVGVLSDSIDDTGGSYAAALASGDVSPVRVLPGQAGSGAGEGLAMLEIVHDLAPDSQLYFATAFNGPASFAQNIRDLRAAGCDIIIDDVGYFNESPFQDDQISQAVSAVTASGALYFSSASNSGSIRAKTSGTWEGDFNDGGAITGPIAGTTLNAAKGYRVHQFTGIDQISGAALSQPFTAFPAAAPTAGGTRYGELFWSDPLGKSTNDYDLFFLSADGATILASSTNAQTGTQDPYELFTVPGTSFINKRFVIVKAASAAPRFLHFDTGRGYITIATNGVTRGHSAVPAAFSTAATPAAAPADPGVAAGRIAANPGPFPGPFTSANTTEGFSSDGPRHVFYNVDGTPITPGNLSSTGGAIRLKPDITAADGVHTTLPAASGLNPFYGTSASAPHAGAIAALLKSYNISLTPAQVRSIFTGPAAIDIDAPGYDITAGYGIVDAYSALAATTSNPAEFVDLTLSLPSVHGGGTSTGTVTIKDPAPAGGVTITLTSSNPAVVVPASVTIPQGATSATFPIMAAVVTTSLNANITATYLTQTRGATLSVLAQYNISGRVTTQTGAGIPGVTITSQAPGDTPPAPQTNTPATPIAIPDATSSGSGAPVTLPITFNSSGAVGAISVGINITHTYRGDLLIALFAPDGSYVILKNPSNDSTPNYNTTFPSPTAPDQPLSTLFGKPLAGTWKLYVQDTGPGDVGTLNSFSLALTPLSTVTDSNGAYSFQNLAATTLMLSPILSGYTFVPVTRTVTIGPDAINENFTVLQPGIRVSATVTKGSDYAVTVTLANSGADAANAQITRATLGLTPPSTPALPVGVGTIAQNSSVPVVLHFPLTAGPSGAKVLLRISGSYTNGFFVGSPLVKLP